jgi:hypothetical protein
MDQQIHFLDANHQVARTALSPPDNDGVLNPSAKEDYLPAQPQTAFESSAFALITGVLMSGSLVAAVGALIRAIAGALG